MSTAPGEPASLTEPNRSTAHLSTYFHQVDRLVEELEGRVAEHGIASVNVNDLMKEYIGFCQKSFDLLMVFGMQSIIFPLKFRKLVFQ